MISVLHIHKRGDWHIFSAKSSLYIIVFAIFPFYHAFSWSSFQRLSLDTHKCERYSGFLFQWSPLSLVSLVCLLPCSISSAKLCGKTNTIQHLFKLFLLETTSGIPHAFLTSPLMYSLSCFYTNFGGTSNMQCNDLVSI